MKQEEIMVFGEPKVAIKEKWSVKDLFNWAMPSYAREMGFVPERAFFLPTEEKGKWELCFRDKDSGGQMYKTSMIISTVLTEKCIYDHKEFFDIAWYDPSLSKQLGEWSHHST